LPTLDKGGWSDTDTPSLTAAKYRTIKKKKIKKMHILPFKTKCHVPVMGALVVGSVVAFYILFLYENPRCNLYNSVNLSTSCYLFCDYELACNLCLCLTSFLRARARLMDLLLLRQEGCEQQAPPSRFFIQCCQDSCSAVL